MSSREAGSGLARAWPPMQKRCLRARKARKQRSAGALGSNGSLQYLRVSLARGGHAGAKSTSNVMPGPGSVEGENPTLGYRVDPYHGDRPRRLGSSSYDPDRGLSAMGMPEKSAFMRLNAK